MSSKEEEKEEIIGYIKVEISLPALVTRVRSTSDRTLLELIQDELEFPYEGRLESLIDAINDDPEITVTVTAYDSNYGLVANRSAVKTVDRDVFHD